MAERGEAIILCVTSLGRSLSEPSLRETSGLNHARWICIQPFVKIQFALREKGVGGEVEEIYASTAKSFDLTKECAMIKTVELT